MNRRDRRRARPQVQPRPENWAGLGALAKKLVDCRTTRAGRAIVDVQAPELRALGQQLARISDGESALVVFKQDLTTWRANKSKGRNTDAYHGDKQACAFLYWKNRCTGMSQHDAVTGAIKAVFNGKDQLPASKTILRIAGKHKERMLDAIAGKSVVRLKDGSVKVEFCSGVDVSKVRNSIKQKSRRGSFGH
jgi:hypothetical protein